ncbi:hypothetical protein BGZ94_007755, partial [Podila epigama]
THVTLGQRTMLAEEIEDGGREHCDHRFPSVLLMDNHYAHVSGWDRPALGPCVGAAGADVADTVGVDVVALVAVDVDVAVAAPATEMDHLNIGVLARHEQDIHTHGCIHIRAFRIRVWQHMDDFGMHLAPSTGQMGVAENTPEWVKKAAYNAMH